MYIILQKCGVHCYLTQKSLKLKMEGTSWRFSNSTPIPMISVLDCYELLSASVFFLKLTNAKWKDIMERVGGDIYSSRKILDHTAAVMADAPPSSPPGHVDTDKFVETLTAEVLEVVEASFEKKIDPVLKRLETCAASISILYAQMKEAEGRISMQEDITASHSARLSEVELKLEAALDKIDDLENRSRRCNTQVLVI